MFRLCACVLNTGTSLSLSKYPDASYNYSTIVFKGMCICRVEPSVIACLSSVSGLSLLVHTLVRLNTQRTWVHRHVMGGKPVTTGFPLT